MLIVFSGLLVIGAGIGLRMAFDYYAKSPRLAVYEKKNAELRAKYIALSNAVDSDEMVLSSFQRKDDRLYRSVFGLDPLPASIREAGTGGSNTNLSLDAISDPSLVIDVAEQIDKLYTKAIIQSSSFEDLKEAAIKNQELLARKPLIQPISPADRYWLTSMYGYRSDPFNKGRKMHHGVDLAGQIGIEVHATGDGIVKVAELNRHGYGKEVIIDHGFGYTSRYAHLNDILVSEGDMIKRGQRIGTLGNSGRSTGPHLHYELRQDNKYLNPLFYYFEELSPDEYNLIVRRANSE
ncbi:M23 family metallopeptidase [Bacteroidota bacterium]